MSNQSTILPCGKDNKPIGTEEPVQLYRIRVFYNNNKETESNAWLLAHPEIKPVSIACDDSNHLFMLYTIK